MLPLVCTCGEILGNKQLVYEDNMRKVCEELGIDFDMVSQGLVDKNEDFKKKRCDIVNKLCRRICCKQIMITYVDIAQLIKG
jgi:DNA-directed RNA polymerase subunit N (RpoN/RPB10)